MRTITAKFPSKCPACGLEITRGSQISYDPESKKAFHPECAEDAEGPDEKPDPRNDDLADKLGFQ